MSVRAKPSARDVARFLVAPIEARAGALRAEASLRTAGATGRRFVVGPWLSEIGFEVLYWIPLLNWFMSRYDVDPERVVAISRGGVRSWYRDLAASYVETFDHFSPEDLKEWHRRRVTETRSQKQMGVSSFDREILRVAAGDADLDGATLLHPSLMYRMFRFFWAERRPIGLVSDRTLHRELHHPDGSEPPPADLPTDYVALKAYFSSCFPDTDDNRAFLAALLESLARHTDVVVLSTGLGIDDHSDFEPAAAHRIYSASSLMTPATNLEVQTRLISRARALVTTYGGFSYLGPLLGVPSLSFYSDENFNATHLDVMRRVVAKLRDARQGATFAALHTRDFWLYDLVSGLSAERSPA
jgi:hypothetical protein